MRQSTLGPSPPPNYLMIIPWEDFVLNKIPVTTDPKGEDSGKKRTALLPWSKRWHSIFFIFIRKIGIMEFCFKVFH